MGVDLIDHAAVPHQQKPVCLQGSCIDHIGIQGNDLCAGDAAVCDLRRADGAVCNQPAVCRNEIRCQLFRCNGLASDMNGRDLAGFDFFSRHGARCQVRGIDGFRSYIFGSNAACFQGCNAQRAVNQYISVYAAREGRAPDAAGCGDHHACAGCCPGTQGALRLHGKAFVEDKHLPRHGCKGNGISLIPHFHTAAQQKVRVALPHKGSLFHIQPLQRMEKALPQRIRMRLTIAKQGVPLHRHHFIRKDAHLFGIQPGAVLRIPGRVKGIHLDGPHGTERRFSILPDQSIFRFQKIRRCAIWVFNGGDAQFAFPVHMGK